MFSKKTRARSGLFKHIEGVIVWLTVRNIIKINNAAANLLGVKLEACRNKKIDIIIKNSELLNFIKETLAGNASIERDILTINNGQKLVRAYGTPINDLKHPNIEAIIVLNDITRLRHLENIRKDFVSNVSHRN
ncbi:MAG: cell wall metabolism sensor histidine kinase WalK [Bacillus subtilis]|nr:cell wall metabolism sensor histidine kinase WalK [Bacillus subtilis]